MSKPWPTLAVLYMKYFDAEKGKVVRRMMTDFFMEKGNLRITIKNTSFRDGSVVDGTATNKDYFTYRKYKDDFMKNRQRRMDEMGEARPKGQAVFHSNRFRPLILKNQKAHSNMALNPSQEIFSSIHQVKL